MTKHLLYLALMGMFIAFVSCGNTQKKAQQSSAAKIIFEQGGYADILNKAKNTGKPIMIDFYTTWCGPCKVLEKEVFTNKTVATYLNDNFLTCKIDAEKGEGPKLANKYNIKGYPTLLYINQKGEVLAENLGLVNAQQLLRTAKNVVQQNK